MQQTVQDGAPVRIVDPELARQWLTRNVSNRRLYKNRVERLAGAMRRGNWEENGHTIKFDQDFNLLDGQHRLHAVIKSGKSVPMRVVFGLDRKVFWSIDTGRPRGGADVLSINGEKEHVRLAATVNLCMRYDARAFRNLNQGTENDELLDYLERWPQLRDSVLEVARKHKNVEKLLTPSISAFLHFAAFRGSLSDDKRDEFFLKFKGDVPCGGTDPVFHLRERMVGRLAGNRMHRIEIFGLAVKAWNAHHEGREVRRLRYISSEAAPIALGWEPEKNKEDD